MKTAGFIISHKNGEGRRALLPSDIRNGVANAGQLYFEYGYGEAIGIEDAEYADAGCHMVSREEALQCGILVDVKLGDADYLETLGEGKILMGWAHAVQSLNFTGKVLNGGHTVIAWEEIYEDGRYIFYRNREIAGEAAILHAYRYCKKMPYDTKAAILGNGKTAKGAMRVLHGLGASVDVYDRKLENLFKKNMYDYDVLVNCVMWDTNRKDRIIYREDLKKMKPGTLIIDVSCDPYLEIETSHPTTIDDPVYEVDRVIHYAVDNTPAMYSKTVTKVLSSGMARLIDDVLTEQYPESVKNAVVIDRGHIVDENIRKFREARGVFCR